jgi:hypothetical protein
MYFSKSLLGVLLLLATGVQAQTIKVTRKPSFADVTHVCGLAATFAPLKFHDLDSKTEIDIDLAKHEIDLTGDGKEEFIEHRYIGTIQQPAIVIGVASDPDAFDPRFPEHVSERHEHAGDDNRYAAVKYQGHLYFVNFWQNELDSIDVRVESTRMNDGFTFPSERMACSFLPPPKPHLVIEMLLYCGLPDANGKATGVPSRCEFNERT